MLAQFRKPAGARVERAAVLGGDSNGERFDRIDCGPIESRLQALDDFRSDFKKLLAAVVRAMQTEDPMFLIEREALLAYAVLDTFLPIFETTTDEETKLTAALLLTRSLDTFDLSNSNKSHRLTLVVTQHKYRAFVDDHQLQ